jgi:hypothetical protein
MEQAKELLQQLAARAGEFSGTLAAARGYILDHFGNSGLIAAYVLLAVLGFVVVYRLVKITIAAIKYVVIPAVVLALLATMILPYPFATVLPVTVTGCSLVLLIKG